MSYADELIEPSMFPPWPGGVSETPLQKPLPWRKPPFFKRGRVRVWFKWYDLSIGLYWSSYSRSLYFHLPMFVAQLCLRRRPAR